ncbi:hypothetical protein KJI95_02655 [Shewanella sp. JM162201]|uniref:Uncharacterized protein n=1 Tax=Shewanella jiangmenensis TaxID=2837387 RepID=A0ABS5UZ27_9GAMM|nr:hypothetical protein [Shewanella jiangmenensis]MBT1443424.1 hypothetical protein [Shewanella jiangmenensis]
MIDKTNPAGRLYKILLTAKGHADNQSVKAVWSNVLNVEDNDIEITKAVLELYSLASHTQLLIKMKKGLNHDLYLSSFNQIERLLIPINLSLTWGHIRGNLTEESLTRLQFCAEELSRFYTEESLSEEELKNIVSKIEALFDSVNSSNLPDTLRLTILEEVARLKHAVTMYQIKGAKGLKDALQGTIGAIVANQEELRTVRNENQDVIERLGELIDKLDSFTARALKLKEIVSKPIRYLLKVITEPDIVDNEGVDAEA